MLEDMLEEREDRPQATYSFTSDQRAKLLEMNATNRNAKKNG
jgi:hypothetical protein